MKSLRNLPIAVILSIMLSQCITKDAIDGPVPPQVNPSDDISNIEVDSAYIPELKDMCGEWRAEYTGFDNRQSCNSSIKRLVSINSDSLYDSKVYGVLYNGKDTTANYVLYEHEAGKLEFKSGTRDVVYRVDYDSVIDFRTQALKEYKLKFETMTPEYHESVLLSKLNEGKRSWIRIDQGLLSAIDSVSLLRYNMNKF